MKISARNVLAGTVVAITHGAINSEVVVKADSGSEIVAIISKESAERLQLAVGKQTYAIIKASNVMLATD